MFMMQDGTCSQAIPKTESMKRPFEGVLKPANTPSANSKSLIFAFLLFALTTVWGQRVFFERNK